jgi:uncharacterized membrane protein YedE/YeeE
MSQNTRTAEAAPARERLVPYLVVGTLFGIMLTKSEVISWFRIQEMFRFQSFHMYGIIGLAVITAAISLLAIKTLSIRSLDGARIELPTKVMGRIRPNHLLGGIVFGLGWALVGACPGPIFALVGNGVSVMIVALASALAGAWTYGRFRSRLPH